MKIKTNTLTPIQINYLVAVLEGHDPICGTNGNHLYNDHDKVDFEYSTNRSQGGPIIEREGIALGKNGTIGTPNAYEAGDDSNIHYGPTPLIAAMRCYIASKLGDEVDIPAELIK